MDADVPQRLPLGQVILILSLCRPTHVAGVSFFNVVTRSLF